MSEWFPVGCVCVWGGSGTGKGTQTLLLISWGGLLLQQGTDSQLGARFPYHSYLLEGHLQDRLSPKG